MSDSAADLAAKVAEQANADIILYNGPIARPFDTNFIQICNLRRRRSNVLLIMVTEGGNADAAYRISRCLQCSYERFSFLTSGYCKSAGTLVALGAHEIIFSKHGELGPLDVQLSKKDELWEGQSGLTVTASLAALQEKAYATFEHFLLATKVRSGGGISFKLATEVASRLASSLFSPLYAQLDPVHIGEAGRALSIADHYGRRLQEYSQNYDPEMIGFLISGYPSHGFVIDEKEASLLFHNVRSVNALEGELLGRLEGSGLFPSSEVSKCPFNFLVAESEDAHGTENAQPDASIASSATGEAPEAEREQTRRPAEDAAANASKPDKSQDTGVVELQRAPDKARHKA